jgi:flagellar basal-body rod modification protein FlgD
VTIDPTAARTATSDPGVQGQKPNALGQDAFMKLLVTQLEHQDPTQPKDDSQLIAQLAQFSSLERLTSIDTTLNNLVALFSKAGSSASGSTTSIGTTSGGTTVPASTTSK